jgi:hypothetical protein
MAQSEVGCRGCCGCEYIGNRAWLQTHVIALARLGLAAGMHPYHTTSVQGDCSVHHRPASIFRNIAARQRHIKSCEYPPSTSFATAPNRASATILYRTRRRCSSVERGGRGTSFLLLAMRRHVCHQNSPLTMSCVACPARLVVPNHHRQDACHVR